MHVHVYVYVQVFSVLTQGRQGMSELKQAFLPKDKRLRPLISKMLDVSLQKYSQTRAPPPVALAPPVREPLSP